MTEFDASPEIVIYATAFSVAMNEDTSPERRRIARELMGMFGPSGHRGAKPVERTLAGLIRGAIHDRIHREA